MILQGGGRKKQEEIYKTQLIQNLGFTKVILKTGWQIEKIKGGPTCFKNFEKKIKKVLHSLN